jgi:hypothetical protein
LYLTSLLDSSEKEEIGESSTPDEDDVGVEDDTEMRSRWGYLCDTPISGPWENVIEVFARMKRMMDQIKEQ